MKTVALAVLITVVAGQRATAGPKLLLTPQRLHRLERDRERQTDRWLDFAKRVETVPDSEERGFELALFYAVTHDEAQGRASLAWASQHPCAIRQVALILNWAGDLASDDQRQTLASFHNCPEDPSIAVRARDRLFEAVARHDDPTPEPPQFGDLRHTADVYATAEYLEGFHDTQTDDISQKNSRYWERLPVTFILSFRPAELEAPSWHQHVAALALVALHPDMQGSQFLQGWATEDRFRLRSGPGVAYELLWADPYLPGIGYQNMDPWLYVETPPHLLARTDWTPGACWMSLQPDQNSTENCPASIDSEAASFGTMKLIPLSQGCTELERIPLNHSVLIHTAPAVRIIFERNRKKAEARSDALGLWKVPEDVSGKVCVKP